LTEYARNFRDFGHLDQVNVIVIPDMKTPAAAYERCQALAAEGLHVSCPSIAEQEKFLAGIGMPPHMVPYNSDNRRNIGYLMAYASGADFLISIDDDNYCLPSEDFFQAHSVVCGDAATMEVLESPTGYSNICKLLHSRASEYLYPRGFPYAARHRSETEQVVTLEGAVHINAGLWTLDPDIDAISWLVIKPHVTGFNGRSVVLGRNTWAPVNSQNTAMRRDATPAYYFIRMGYPIAGMSIDRYGDILSGYFVQACARQVGGLVRVGTPIAEHKRNSHNYMKDAGAEWACIVLLEDILPWLREITLEGTSYTEAFRSLSYSLQDAVEKMHGPLWTDASRGYFHQMAYHIRLWLKACQQIG
jgi:hypothetical protein